MSLMPEEKPKEYDLRILAWLLVPAAFYFGTWLPFIYPKFVDPLYAARTTGTVTGLTNVSTGRSSNGGRILTFPDVEFRTPDGKLHDFTSEVIRYYPTGAAVTVKYSPTRPWLAELEEFKGSMPFIQNVVVGGIILDIIVAVILAYIWLRTRPQVIAHFAIRDPKAPGQDPLHRTVSPFLVIVVIALFLYGAYYVVVKYGVNS